MGLLDVLNGMQNGPRGPSNPSAAPSGMSPMTMAILGLLAWKAVKHLTANNATTQSPAPAPTPSTGGGLGGSLAVPWRRSRRHPERQFGGILGGAAAGSVISGGLGDLLGSSTERTWRAANPWVGPGPTAGRG